MAFRLTILLVAVIYLVMRFGGGPIPEPAPEIAAAPEPEATETATAAPETAEPEARAASEPASDAPDRVTLAPPATLSPATETPDQSPEDAARSAELVTPGAALPEGVAGSASLGLGGALELRDQITAALDEAQDPSGRPSLADLARPGGGQPARQTELDTAPASELETVTNNGAAGGVPGEPRAEVTASAVNLRGGPSTLNAVVGRVTNGEVLELRGEFSGGWAAVGHPDTGETVYISSQFLDPLDN